MTDGFYIIPVVLVISVYILLRVVNAQKTRSETEKKDYHELWQKHGVKLKWWALVLNLGGAFILLNEILSIRGLHGAALAQWQIGVGLTYLFFVSLPSIVVIVCIILFFWFEVNKNNLRHKLPYLFLSVVSVLFPIFLFAKAELLIR